MITSARGLYKMCLAEGIDPKATFSAHCGKTHYMVGSMVRGQWHTGKIKGLYRACWNAKMMAITMDLLTAGEETGVEFWVEQEANENSLSGTIPGNILGWSI